MAGGIWVALLSSLAGVIRTASSVFIGRPRTRCLRASQMLKQTKSHSLQALVFAPSLSRNNAVQCGAGVSPAPLGWQSERTIRSAFAPHLLVRRYETACSN